MFLFAWYERSGTYKMKAQKFGHGNTSGWLSMMDPLMLKSVLCKSKQEKRGNCSFCASDVVTKC